jgi:hypothetical protein
MFSGSQFWRTNTCALFQLHPDPDPDVTEIMYASYERNDCLLYLARNLLMTTVKPMASKHH